MSCWPGTPDSITTVTAADGVELTVEEYAPAAEPRTVLVFLHGIGAYAGPYRAFAREVAEAGVFVYLPDLRGHGRSGTRGHMGAPATVMAGIQVLMEHARAAHPGCEVVLGGESMGGLFATAYTASDRRAPDRLLLVAPALQPAWRQWVKVALAPRTGPRPTDAGQGSIPLHSSMPGDSSRNPGFRDMCHDDPLMLQHGSIGYIATVVWFNLGWAMRYPSKFRQPVLIVHGDADAVVALGGSDALAARVRDADLRVVREAWHNLFWDPTRDATVGEIAGWLAGRRGGSKR
jgi:acylglycerol lipase